MKNASLIVNFKFLRKVFEDLETFSVNETKDFRYQPGFFWCIVRHFSELLGADGMDVGNV